MDLDTVSILQLALRDTPGVERTFFTAETKLAAQFLYWYFVNSDNEQ